MKIFIIKKGIGFMNIKDVYKYLDAKYPKDFPILKPKIDEFYQQGIKPDRIYNLMSQYIDLKPYCWTLDVQNGDIIEFVKAVKIGTFLKAKFNNEESFSIMQKTLVFEDNNICIFKPTNFQESSVIGEPICCFAYSQGRWDEHYNGYQEAIYYVYDVMKEGTQHDFVSITVRPNGRALVLDKEHNWWSKQQSIQYIQSLEEGASYITTKDGKTIKTENKKYKTNTNMAKKQVIRLTEGDLHRIIKESVNKVLREAETVLPNKRGNIDNELMKVLSKYDNFIKKHQETIDSDEQTGCYYRYDNEEECYIVWFSVNLVGVVGNYNEKTLSHQEDVEFREMYVHLRDKMLKEIENLGLTLIDIDEHHDFNTYKFDGQTPCQYRIHDICYFQ